MKGLKISFIVVLLAFSYSITSGGQVIQFDSSPSGATILSQDQSGLLLRIDIGSIELQQVTTREGDFTALSIPGFSRSYEIGEPNLPVVNRIIAIPFGCEIKAAAISYGTEEISLGARGFAAPVLPAQPPLSKSQKPGDIPFEFKRDIYVRSGYYSLPLGSASEIGVMRALRLGIVSVAPVEYDPSANTIKVHKNVVVRVEYLHPDWVKTEQMRKRYFSPCFESVYSRIINYEPLPSLALDDLVKYPVKYVIVADRMFEAQLQPFIEWKIKKGFDVIIAYTDVIGHSNTQIKAYLNDLYDAGNPDDPAPSFILLVGDDQQISAFQYAGHISDLDFGEYTNDHIPEVYYGRFSAQNASQLQPQIDKTLEYEQYQMADPGFLDDVTLIAGVDAYYAQTYGNGQINYGTNNYFNPEHNLVANVWLYPRSDDPGASAEIVQTVNDGVSFINYTAHGSHEGWYDPSFEIGQINGLTNAGKYPLAVGNCCLTNTFGDDYPTPCAGEVWLQSENKGAVGYIGASNSSYWDEDYWWGVGFKNVVPEGPPYDPNHLGSYDGLFHDHGEAPEDYYVTNDAMLFCGNLAVQESNSTIKNYYWEIYHLMGDPSVMTYVGMPAVNAVDHPEVITLGESSITVYADPYSYAGLSINGVLHGAVFIEESGTGILNFEPFDVPGSADFVVSAQNKQPYIASIPVIAPSGPYVIFDSCMVNDINGNNNGLIDFGENILLGMRLVNVGPDPANEVIAVLISDDPFVAIYDSIASFGDIPGNFGTSEVPDAYAFLVQTGIPDGHIIEFQLDIISGADNWTSNFTLPAHAPELAFVDVVINDESGNGNGIFEAGETVEMVVTLHNDGSCPAASVSGAISTRDAYVTIDDAAGTFGDIAPSENANNSGDVFVVTAHEDMPPGHAIVFNMDLTADGGYLQSIEFYLKSIESFEYNDGDWTGNGCWQWGEPTSGPGSAYDGTKVWATNLSGQYPDNADDNLFTCFYTVESSEASFSFYQWYSFESTYDGGNVSISTDSGNSWELLTPSGDYPDPDVYGLDGEPGYSGESGGWQEATFSLGAYEGSIVVIRLRLGTDGSVVRDGWYIDAVTVMGARAWRGNPNISFNPNSYNVTLVQGDSADRILNIGNSGEGVLAYSIRPITVGRRIRGNDGTDVTTGQPGRDPGWEKQVEHIRNGDFLAINYKGPKLESRDSYGNPPVITDFGGPNDFGYMWIDSNEPAGPVFEWVDITGIGQPLQFPDEGNQGPFPLGFDMPFYEQFFNSIRICSNGWLSFTSTSTEYDNYPIPSTEDPNNVIAPFWDDLNPGDGGMIYFYSNGVDSAIVAWVGIPRWNEGGSMTFETILTADGNIIFQYESMQGTLNSSTVGIENSSGSIGLQVVCNGGYVSDGLAVKFILPIFWLAVDPRSGLNLPGESSDFTVTFNAAELDTGTFTGYLQIDSNDPDDPTVAVECTLIVAEQTGIEEASAGIPTTFSLSQNYPNPFNPTTKISFGLPSAQEVSIRIYDLLGREVITVVDEKLPAGYHDVEFDGSSLASGVYFYRIQAGGFIESKRMVFLK